MTNSAQLPTALLDLFGGVSTRVEAIPLSRVESEFRPVRFGEAPDRIDMFQGLLAEDVEAVPPVILVGRGIDCLIADGWHRILAAVALDRSDILAIVLPGLPGMTSEQTARLIGARMTATASQPLTKAERKALAIALAEDHPDWSDRQVARECGLDHKTVGRLRRGTSSETDVEPAGEGTYLAATVDQAVRQLDRFVVKLRDSAVFNNLTRFRKGTTRKLGWALAERYGSEAPDVARTVSRYFAEAAEALVE